MRRCPRCYTANPEQARFCAGCGAELPRQCSYCRGVVPPAARFCPDCGAAQPVLPDFWLKGRLTPAGRARLVAAARRSGSVLIVIAAVSAMLVPPWDVLIEMLLLVVGMILLLLANLFDPARRPDEDAAYTTIRSSLARIAVIPPDEAVHIDAWNDHLLPPGSTQGPYLN